MNENKNFMQEVKGEMRTRIMGLIRKPTAPPKKKTIKNMAPLALIGFNVVMTFLDLISAIAVAMLTNWLYGALTFIAGVLALFVWERLFTNAHANMMQKWISIGGGVLAVLSTLGIGVLSALVNVFNIAGVVSSIVLEAGMLISLVVVTFIHGIAWGVYYFADPAHVAEMKRQVNIAWREQQKQGIEDAKEDLNAVLEIDKELQEYEKKGQLDLLSASYETMRGQSLVQNDADLTQDPEYQEWLRKGAVVIDSDPRFSKAVNDLKEGGMFPREDGGKRPFSPLPDLDGEI